MRWYSDEDILDWVKVGGGCGRETTGAWESRLFTSRNSSRGYGAKPTSADPTFPFVTVKFGHTERRDIGGRARQTHQERLRAQSNYIDRDEARADGFDRDGDVRSTWERVKDWADDRRYFRTIVSPLEGDRVRDWRAFMRDFMNAFEERILTPKERDERVGLDWTSTLHTNTDHPHTHTIIRGKIGNSDLWLAPGFIADLHRLARSIASDERHLGRQPEKTAESVSEAIKNMERDIKREDRDMSRRPVGNGMELG